MKGEWIFNVFFILIWLVLPILHFIGITSSFSAPLLIGLGVLFLIYFLKYKVFVNFIFNNKSLVFFYILLMHSFLCSFLFKIDFVRLTFSLLYILLLFYSSSICIKLIRQYEGVKFHEFVNVVYYVLIFFFIFSLITPFKLSDIHSKPIFPYNEPSHYCLFFGPFMYYKIITSNKKIRIVFLLIPILIAFFSQNLIMFISTMFIFAFLNRKNVFLIFLVLYSSFLLLSNIDYFASRLIISNESNNLSVLSYLQGWDFAYNHFFNSNFIGIGIQQFGIYPLETEISMQIENLVGEKMNENNGSAEAAKLIAEFGLLGVFMLIYYFNTLFKSLKFLSNCDFFEKKDSIILFCCCSIFSFFVELFVRGVGYFSPTSFLFFMSLVFLSENNFRPIPKKFIN